MELWFFNAQRIEFTDDILPKQDYYLVLGNRVLQHTDLFIEPRYWGYLHSDSWLIGVAKNAYEMNGQMQNPDLYLYTFFDLNWDIAIFLSGTKANLLYWQSLTFHFVVGHYGPDHLLSIHYRSIMNIIGKKSASLKFLPF